MILDRFFIPFGYRIVILDRFFAYFVSRMEIPDRSFIPFGSWIGIPGESFISFGSWIEISAGFLILRTCPKSDPYKDSLIFYRGNSTLHGFGYVIASRKDSSFLSLMKEKKQKKIKAMIAISFCLVHVIHG